jgi:hypothetical protein
MLDAAHLQIKGGSFRDLPLTRELSASLEEWESQAGKNLPKRFQLCGLHQRGRSQRPMTNEQAAALGLYLPSSF